MATVKYKSSQVIWEAMNYGDQYVQKKYGMAVYNKMQPSIKAKRQGNQGRATAASSSNGKDTTVRVGSGFEQREIGDSSMNKAPDAHNSGAWMPQSLSLRGEGGPSDAVTSSGRPQLSPMQLNIENDSALPQGSHTKWAQPSSVSSLITGLLRESQTSSTDYWNEWSKSKNGTVQVGSQSSSPFGNVVNYTSNSQMAQNQPLGAFGTSMVMNNYGDDGEFSEDQLTSVPNPNDPAYNPATDPNSDLGMNSQPMDTSGFPDPYQDSTQAGPPGQYNPWGFMGGAESNQYGPSQDQMAQSTMEAMSLANAYFSPQRMELAYQLGDMETDMRRLAVNLGRQVDDPILQAKLYKDAQRAVRTLDVQQNTFAYQMAEQRRREDTQNFQFYDQLAQEELRLRMANEQFNRNYTLSANTYNLQRDQVAAQMRAGMAQPSAPGSAPPAGENSVDPNWLYNNTMNKSGNLL